MTQVATSEDNLDFLREVKEKGAMTHKQVAELTCYEIDTVRAWFAPPDSTKFRKVPDRAVQLAKAKLQNSY